MDQFNDCTTRVPEDTYNVEYNGEVIATCKVHSLADRSEIEDNTIVWKTKNGTPELYPVSPSKTIIWNVLKALVSWRNGEITYENVAKHRFDTELIFHHVQKKEKEIAESIEANLKN